MRFLVNVLEAGLADRARREGYTREERALGWKLWCTAAGEARPFEHWLREQQLVEGVDLDNDEQRRRLQEIDEFENTWFPRTKAIIRRVVSKQRRDAFAAAFFEDLVQQSLGPAVVGSVGTYLTRLAGLGASTDPDAKAVRATLRSRGLTDGKLAAVARLLEETKAGAKGSKEPSTPEATARPFVRPPPRAPAWPIHGPPPGPILPVAHLHPPPHVPARMDVPAPAPAIAQAAAFPLLTRPR